MFDFDVFVSSELKALCAELKVVLANSARKSEYVDALKKYFEAENVVENLMGLDRKALQNVSRRLSLSRSGSKREMTDAILAKVIPQPEPVVVDPDRLFHNFVLSSHNGLVGGHFSTSFSSALRRWGPIYPNSGMNRPKECV